MESFRAQKEFAEGRQGIGGIATLTARNFDDIRLIDEINKNAFTSGLDGWTFLDSSPNMGFCRCIRLKHTVTHPNEEKKKRENF